MRSNRAGQRFSGGGLAPWQVRRATLLLLSHNPEDHGLDMLATACGLSRSHFGRAFKASTGMPPHQWLLRHHVQQAVEMLEGTDDSISTIAVKCGFADQSHLSRVFHTFMGTTPADWRRQRKANVLIGRVAASQPLPCEKVGSWMTKEERRLALISLVIACLSALVEDVSLGSL